MVLSRRSCHLCKPFKPFILKGILWMPIAQPHCSSAPILTASGTDIWAPSPSLVSSCTRQSFHSRSSTSHHGSLNSLVWACTQAGGHWAVRSLLEWHLADTLEVGTRKREDLVPQLSDKNHHKCRHPWVIPGPITRFVSEACGHLDPRFSPGILSSWQRCQDWNQVLSLLVNN